MSMRCLDLSRLTLQGKKYSAEGAVLRFAGLAKQGRPGKESSLWPAVISPFPEDPLLCPVSCLKAYKKATGAFRGKDKLQLFLAINSPHSPVITSTIARWLKQAIVASGIDPQFSAHSMRGASSTAAAMNGITIWEVMERAGWSRQDTLCKHYFRPSEQALVAAKYGACIGYIYVDRTGTLRNTIWEWLRLLCSCVLFLVVWGGWRWTSTCPPHPSILPPCLVLLVYLYTLDWLLIYE